MAHDSHGVSPNGVSARQQITSEATGQRGFTGGKWQARSTVWSTEGLASNLRRCALLPTAAEGRRPS
jgi:hypothetical protein